MNQLRNISCFLLLIAISSCISPKYSKRALVKDTKYFYKRLIDVHPNIYVHYAQPEFSKDSIELFISLKRMDRLEYYRTLKPIMAKIRDEHTRLELPVWIDLLNQTQKTKTQLWFPVSIVIHNDTAFVVNAGKNSTDIPLGSKILSINGRPIHEIVTRILEFNESYNRNCFVGMTEFNFGKGLWEDFGYKDTFRVKYEEPTGQICDTTLLGQKAWKTQVEIFNWWEKYNTNDSLLPKTTVTRSNESFSYRVFEDSTCAYLNFSSCSPNESNDTLLQNFFSILKERKIKNLIVDVRRNHGGATSVNEQLLQYIGKRPYTSVSDAFVKTSKPLKKYCKKEKELMPYIINEVKKYYTGTPEVSSNPLLFKGDVYVLAGTETFSSAANFVAVVKDCGLATVVGEETGGLASGYGDYLIFRLPKSGLKLRVATKYLVRPSGCIIPQGVIPDIFVEKTLSDKLYNRDVVLRKVIELIKK